MFNTFYDVSLWCKIDQNLISKWHNEAKTTFCDAGDLSPGSSLLDLNHGAPSLRPGRQLNAHKFRDTTSTVPVHALPRNYLRKEIVVVDFPIHSNNNRPNWSTELGSQSGSQCTAHKCELIFCECPHLTAHKSQLFNLCSHTKIKYIFLLKTISYPFFLPFLSTYLKKYFLRVFAVFWSVRDDSLLWWQ